MWRGHGEEVIKLEQNLHEVEWREKVWKGRLGTGWNANLRNLEFFEGPWGPLKVFEHADHKCRGGVPRCVPGEVNWVVEQRMGCSGEALTAASK